MKGFVGYLAGGFLFHEAFVADDGFVCDRHAEVVDGASSGQGLVVLFLMSFNVFSEDGQGHRQQESQISVTEESALIVSLAAESGDACASDVGPTLAIDQGVDVLGRDEVEYDGDQACVFDAFFSPGWIVGGHGEPDNLSGSNAIAGSVETVEESFDLLSEQFGDGGTEDAGELALKQVLECVVKGLASRGIEVAGGGMGMGFHVRNPFFSLERWLFSTRVRIS
jgi:hypothetical protein